MSRPGCQATQARSEHAVFDLPGVIEDMPGEAADEVTRRPTEPAARPARFDFAAGGCGQPIQNCLPG